MKPTNSPLTAREHEVAALVAQGYERHEIAAMLSVAVKTVDSHRLAALAKLQLSNNVHLAAYFARMGWVPAALAVTSSEVALLRRMLSPRLSTELNQATAILDRLAAACGGEVAP